MCERVRFITEAATFGRGARDVYDPEYRRALKMEPTKFAGVCFY